MNEIAGPMALVVSAWLSVIVLVIRHVTRSAQPSVGLPITMLLSMTFLYCGAFVYMVPGYTHLRGDGSIYLQAYRFQNETVLRGAVLSLAGVIAFATGVFASSALLRRTSHRAASPSSGLPQRTFALNALGALALAGFILNFVNIQFPLVQAVGQVLRNLAPVVVCLAAYGAYKTGKRPSVALLALAVVVPITYVVAWGFTSYAYLIATIYVGFWLATLYRRGRLSSVATAIVGGASFYAALCVFVAWISFRDELRRVLWSDAGFWTRISALSSAFGKTVLLSPFDFRSLDLINARLSQCIFIGKAIELHDIAPALQQHGRTLLLAIFAIVPRFVWPDKPEMRDNLLLTQNTGIEFSRNATFGSGAVFEFFVNFGAPGVVVGFFLLGMAVRAVDRSAGSALREDRMIDCARWFAVGLALISPLTSFFFLVNTALMSWLALTAVKFALGAGGAPAPRRRAIT